MATRGASAKVVTEDTSNFSLIDALAPLGSNQTTDSSAQDQKAADPINWFCGVLVPPQLRHAQSSFRRSIRLVTELATKRAALLKSGDRLAELISRRKRIDLETPLISLTDTA